MGEKIAYAIITLMLIVFGLSLYFVFTKNELPPIEHSGYEICSSAFHTKCEGICQGTSGLVLHYGYRRGKCKFETFNETQEEEMWEEFCDLIE